ncbi:hypothetical protein Ae201684P_006656 [Aphanomyces euteiches]|nr:hypothetical protein Ae201684P_006656 [Aphanomyces euteiches]
MARVVRASIDPLIQLGLTPSQARGELSFTVPEDILPTLKQFQNRHQYVRTTQILENSKPSIMREILLSKRFVADMSDTQYFTFGYDIIGESPQFGIGGPDDPFTVGVTTKTLLRQMNRDPASFVFHWDATYKINSKEFPVLVCGITDIARQFHPRKVGAAHKTTDFIGSAASRVDIGASFPKMHFECRLLISIVYLVQLELRLKLQLTWD